MGDYRLTGAGGQEVRCYFLFLCTHMDSLTLAPCPIASICLLLPALVGLHRCGLTTGSAGITNKNAGGTAPGGWGGALSPTAVAVAAAGTASNAFAGPPPC
jgi:hypothetical protein